jgi:hypothetical protein
MSVETVRREQEVTVYQCDVTTGMDRCVRQTASFQRVDAVAVLLDAAWLTVRVGLGEEKHFCSWIHLTQWVAQQSAGGADAETFGARMVRAAEARDRRESEAAEHLRARLASQQESAGILGMGAGG